MEKKDYIAVVGGINIDICAKSFAPLREKDSNPGAITTSFGGVGRNIAHNISLMGIPVMFFGVYGEDSNGKAAVAHCESLGMDMSHTEMISGATTSTYLFVASPQGEMNIAVSDMNICDFITPAYIEKNLDALNAAKAVVFDTNAPKETLEYLVNNCTAPLFCDPVSTIKAEKVRNVLGRIHTLKPNKLEAEVLSGVHISDLESMKKASAALLSTGLKRVFISMGEEGIYAMQSMDDFCILPIIKGTMINSTGCGDAFMAAVAYSYYHDKTLRESAWAGQAAGSIALESKETINPLMSENLLLERMKQIEL